MAIPGKGCNSERIIPCYISFKITSRTLDHANDHHLKIIFQNIFCLYCIVINTACMWTISARQLTWKQSKIQRYILSLTNKQTVNLIKALKERKKKIKLLVDYTFPHGSLCNKFKKSSYVEFFFLTLINAVCDSNIYLL